MANAMQSIADGQRDSRLRELYALRALKTVPRLLGAIDRNPYHRTYGCLDRQYWHYRTAAFPSEMYQEGALPLALACTADLPGNRWYENGRVRELAAAAVRFAAASSHADGSCDDYYPFERALGAAVFSLQATARAYQLLALDDPPIVAWFRRRADWIIANGESGRLTNHHALAALGLLRVAEITGDDQYRRAAADKIALVLDWQHDEGWFDEYGGADPGYQTVTIDSLAKIRRSTGNAALDEPLRRAVAFAREFLHPDDSYGGEYGSRGTYHFYPHGMELLIADNPQAAADAAALADGFLKSLARGTAARFDDDRLFAHRAGNMFEAYLDWSPQALAGKQPVAPSTTDKQPMAPVSEGGDASRRTLQTAERYYPAARILVCRSEEGRHTVVSAARGGVFKHFGGDGKAVSDAGLIVETADGRIAVSQGHHMERSVEWQEGKLLAVSGPLNWVRHETASPWKQAAFHAGMCLAGRWCRGLVRRLLQRRLITGRSESGIRLRRRFESGPQTLRVTDVIELTDPRIQIRRMSFGSDHQTAYVAACGVYQDSVLNAWTDLASYVAELNSTGKVTISRCFE